MTTSTCPQCGAEASGRFCSSCAAPLADATCASCGAPITPGARFCHVCGKPSGGAASDASADGQRQVWPWILATVMGGVMVAVIGYVVGQSSGQPAGAQPAQMQSHSSSKPPSLDIRGGHTLPVPSNQNTRTKLISPTLRGGEVT